MNSNKRIAVITPNILNGYAAKLVWSIQAEAFQTGYDVVTYIANSMHLVGGPEYFYHKLTMDKSADSVIIISCGVNEQIISGFKGAGITPVLIDVRWEGINCVRSDNEKGAHDAGTHFGRLGRKKIGMITGDLEQAETQRERFAGFARGLKEYGRVVYPECVWKNEMYTYQSGKEAFRFMVMNDVDAVFCAAGDYVAQGFLNEARKNGMDIPRAMSLIGFDDIESSADMELTTIRQPLEDMGKEALHMAVESLQNPAAKVRDKVFDCRLILRETA